MLDKRGQLSYQKELNAIRQAKEAADFKNDAHNKGWGIYGSDNVYYAYTFGLPYDFFKSRVDTTKYATGRMPCGLDVMSNTAFLRSLGIEGIAIGFTKDEAEVRAEEPYNRHLIAGDILADRKKIWTEVDTMMTTYNFINGFDFITLRGAGGLVSLSDNPIVYHVLLQEMWKRLAVGGILVSEVPYVSQNLIKETNIIGYWNLTKGIKADYVSRGISLEKSDGAPMQLPLNFSPLLSTIRDWHKGLF